MRPAGERPAGRLFTFRSAGWVLLLAALVSGIVVWQVLANLSRYREEVFGDGRDPATYRFALSPALLPCGEIVASGTPRNGIPALVAPARIRYEDLTSSPDRKLRKLLLPSDRVVGIALGGEARAYPLRFLNWHEIVNDVVGGEEVAVTYGPLTDAAAVFSRRVGGEVAEFRVSGLLWNSGLLFYRRQATPGGESLYSQLLARAVTGPDATAGVALRVLPSSVVPLGTWLSRHPDSTLIAPDPVFIKHYPREPYSTYYGTREFRYPVEPRPPAAPDPWSRVLAVFADGGMRLLEDYAGDDAGVPPGSPVIHAFRWAWLASHPAAR